jgi:hypothetical protein
MVGHCPKLLFWCFRKTNKTNKRIVVHIGADLVINCLLVELSMQYIGKYLITYVIRD